MTREIQIEESLIAKLDLKYTYRPDIRDKQVLKRTLKI
jgi:hypothetical protein